MTTTEQYPGVDVEAFTRWMDANDVPGRGEMPRLAALSGGSQNELMMIERGGRKMVMRKPPEGAVADRLDGIRREHRLVKALKGADVPHAAYIAGSDDTDLLGTPFYIMDVVDGWSPADLGGWAEPFQSDLSLRPALAYELVRGAALLSKVDWQARGLTGFGRPDNFHERQVDRWLAFLERIKCRELPGLMEAAAWLRTHQPKHWSPGIMHGDYQFANVMYKHGAPGELAAIIDWEMTTIGDPLLDLGWILATWGPEVMLENAAFTPAALSGVRKRGWAQSVAEREPGVASVSAPVHSADGTVVASISVSGPIERLTRTPGKLHAQAVVAAGAALSRALAPTSA